MNYEVLRLSLKLGLSLWLGALQDYRAGMRL